MKNIKQISMEKFRFIFRNDNGDSLAGAIHMSRDADAAKDQRTTKNQVEDFEGNKVKTSKEFEAADYGKAEAELLKLASSTGSSEVNAKLKDFVMKKIAALGVMLNGKASLTGKYEKYKDQYDGLKIEADLLAGFDTDQDKSIDFGEWRLVKSYFENKVDTFIALNDKSGDGKLTGDEINNFDVNREIEAVDEFAHFKTDPQNMLIFERYKKLSKVYPAVISIMRKTNPTEWVPSPTVIESRLQLVAKLQQQIPRMRGARRERADSIWNGLENTISEGEKAKDKLINIIANLKNNVLTGSDKDVTAYLSEKIDTHFDGWYKGSADMDNETHNYTIAEYLAVVSEDPLLMSRSFMPVLASDKHNQYLKRNASYEALKQNIEAYDQYLSAVAIGEKTIIKTVLDEYFSGKKPDDITDDQRTDLNKLRQELVVDKERERLTKFVNSAWANKNSLAFDLDRKEQQLFFSGLMNAIQKAEVVPSKNTINSNLKFTYNGKSKTIEDGINMLLTSKNIKENVFADDIGGAPNCTSLIKDDKGLGRSLRFINDIDGGQVAMQKHLVSELEKPKELSELSEDYEKILIKNAQSKIGDYLDNPDVIREATEKVTALLTGLSDAAQLTPEAMELLDMPREDLIKLTAQNIAVGKGFKEVLDSADKSKINEHGIIRQYQSMLGLNGVWSDKTHQKIRDNAVLIGSLILTSFTGNILFALGRYAMMAGNAARITKITRAAKFASRANKGRWSVGTNKVMQFANKVGAGAGRYSGKVLDRLSKTNQGLQTGARIIASSVPTGFRGASIVQNGVRRLVYYPVHWGIEATKFSAIHELLASRLTGHDISIDDFPGVVAQNYKYFAAMGVGMKIGNGLFMKTLGKYSPSAKSMQLLKSVTQNGAQIIGELGMFTVMTMVENYLAGQSTGEIMEEAINPEALIEMGMFSVGMRIAPGLGKLFPNAKKYIINRTSTSRMLMSKKSGAQKKLAKEQAKPKEKQSAKNIQHHEAQIKSLETHIATQVKTNPKEAKVAFEGQIKNINKKVVLKNKKIEAKQDEINKLKAKEDANKGKEQTDASKKIETDLQQAQNEMVQIKLEKQALWNQKLELKKQIKDLAVKQAKPKPVAVDNPVKKLEVQPEKITKIGSMEVAGQKFEYKVQPKEVVAEKLGTLKEGDVIVSRVNENRLDGFETQYVAQVVKVDGQKIMVQEYTISNGGRKGATKSVELTYVDGVLRHSSTNRLVESVMKKNESNISFNGTEWSVKPMKVEVKSVPKVEPSAAKGAVKKSGEVASKAVETKFELGNNTIRISQTKAELANNIKSLAVGETMIGQITFNGKTKTKVAEVVSRDGNMITVREINNGTGEWGKVVENTTYSLKDGKWFKSDGTPFNAIATGQKGLVILPHVKATTEVSKALKESPEGETVGRLGTGISHLNPSIPKAKSQEVIFAEKLAKSKANKPQGSEPIKRIGENTVHPKPVDISISNQAKGKEQPVTRKSELEIELGNAEAALSRAKSSENPNQGRIKALENRVEYYKEAISPPNASLKQSGEVTPLSQAKVKGKPNVTTGNEALVKQAETGKQKLETQLSEKKSELQTEKELVGDRINNAESSRKKIKQEKILAKLDSPKHKLNKEIASLENQIAAKQKIIDQHTHDYGDFKLTNENKLQLDKFKISAKEGENITITTGDGVKVKYTKKNGELILPQAKTEPKIKKVVKDEEVAVKIEKKAEDSVNEAINDAVADKASSKDQILKALGSKTAKILALIGIGTLVSNTLFGQETANAFESLEEAGIVSTDIIGIFKDQYDQSLADWAYENIMLDADINALLDVGALDELFGKDAPAIKEKVAKARQEKYHEPAVEAFKDPANKEAIKSLDPALAGALDDVTLSKDNVDNVTKNKKISQKVTGLQQKINEAIEKAKVNAPDSALAKLPPLAVDGLYGALSKQALEVYKASLTTKPVENPVVPQPEAPQPKNEEIRDEITITDELKIVIREFELLMDDIDFVDAEFWERLDNAKNDTEVGILFEEFNKAYNTSINSFDPCDYLLPTAIVDADIKSINFDGVKQLVSIEAYQSLLTQKPVWETGLDTYKNSIPKKIEIINFDGVNKNLDTFTEADLCQIDKNSAFYEVYKLVRTAVKTYIPAIKKNNKDENAIKFLENIVKSAFANISKFPQKYATLKTLGKKVKDNELVKFEEFIGLFTHTDFYNFEPKIELLNKKLKKVVLNPYKEFKALEKKVLKPKNIASS